MSQTVQVAPQPSAVQKSNSRGCLFGCLAALVALLLMAACGGFGGYYLVSGQVQKYTSETPAEIPTVDFTVEQLSQLEDRLGTFQQALDDGQPAEDLVLSADEINAIIEKNDTLRGKVYIRIEDEKVSGDVSIPVSGIPGGDGRFLNASVTFDVSLDNGVLIVTLVDAEVEGTQVPQPFLEAMGNENLAKDFYKDPENAKLISRFESIRIEDDSIILELRKESDDDSTSDEQTSEDAALVDEQPLSTDD